MPGDVGVEIQLQGAFQSHHLAIDVDRDKIFERHRFRRGDVDEHQDAFLRQVDHDVALAVSVAGIDQFDAYPAQLENRLFTERDVRYRPRRVLVPLQQFLRFLVRDDLRSFGEQGRIADVVQVRMGIDHDFDRQVGHLPDGFLQQRPGATNGIDQDHPLRGGDEQGVVDPVGKEINVLRQRLQEVSFRGQRRDRFDVTVRHPVGRGGELSAGRRRGSGIAGGGRSGHASGTRPEEPHP